LVLLWSCFAQAKADQKETKRREEEEKNKTKAREEGDSYEIAILSNELRQRLYWFIRCVFATLREK